METVKSIIAHKKNDNGIVIIPWDEIASIEEIKNDDGKFESSGIVLKHEFLNVIYVNEKPLALYEQIYGPMGKE